MMQARREAIVEREARQAACEAAALRIQCQARRYFARRAVSKRRAYLWGTGKMSKVIMQQVCPTLPPRPRVLPTQPPLIPSVSSEASRLLLPSAHRPPSTHLSTHSPSPHMLSCPQRYTMWKADRRAARAAGYPSTFLPPEAAERERRRWSAWKRTHLLGGHQVRVQSCPDHFLSNIFRERERPPPTSLKALPAPRDRDGTCRTDSAASSNCDELEA